LRTASTDASTAASTAKMPPANGAAASAAETSPQRAVVTTSTSSCSPAKQAKATFPPGIAIVSTALPCRSMPSSMPPLQRAFHSVSLASIAEPSGAPGSPGPRWIVRSPIPPEATSKG
jgi:hypothetical protein